MHYSCLVVADDVDAALAPFSEHLTVPRTKVLIAPEEVTQMAEHFNVDRLFTWSTHNQNSKWDCTKPADGDDEILNAMDLHS
jgi:hypothetical protein